MQNKHLYISKDCVNQQASNETKGRIGMKQRMHTGLRMFVGIGLSAALLTACGSGGGSGKSAGESPPGKEEAAPDITKQPATVTFYNATANEPQDLFMTKYGDIIAKKFPNYKINYVQAAKGTTLPELITAGTNNVDVIIASIGETYKYVTSLELQDNISDLVTKYKFDMNRLEPSSVDIQRKLSNGGIYGIPFSIATTVLYYNKDIFDMFAQPYPKDGMTWDDLYALTQKVTRSQNGVQYRGLTGAFTHLLRLNQSSAAIVDTKTNKSVFTEDKYKREFENLLRFYKIPGNGLPGKAFNLQEQVDLFNKDQTSAMHLHLTRAAVSLWATTPNFNWDMVQQPQWKDLPGVGPQSYPYYFYLTKTSKNRDAAFQVLAFAASDEFQQFMMKQGYMSALKDPSHLMKDLGTDVPGFKGKNLKAFLPAKYALSPEPYPFASLAEGELNKAFAEVVVDGTDVNTALRGAAERADKAIAAEVAKTAK
ncbi:MAG: hypothetical protein K0Q59_858 [Paenibacillus sp.]|jgi:multiple sugar transport system substrate-binding protein|nr:hypothetical protein [Paenibacillus sp.]